MLLTGRLIVATAFHTGVLEPMYEAIALVCFSFEPPLNNSLEDIGRQNVPSPRLIVPAVMDRLGQRARMPF